MKKFLLIFSCLIGFCIPSFAQATLDLVNSSNSSTVTETVGSTFSLNIDYISTGLPATTLAAFNITLSGSPTLATTLPTGLTFDGFSGLNSGFGGAVSGTDPLIFSAAASSPSNDISSTSPTTLLVATFTVNTAGTYSLFFAPVGSTTTDDQGLFNASSGAITYVPTPALVVAPEPNIASLCLAGLALLFGFRFAKRTSA